MTKEQMAQYDLFLDENDWDIYYWATQAEPSGEPLEKEQPPPPPPGPRAGEWAQTVGAFRPAYRPVPARWRDSEILALLRTHVRERDGSAGGRPGGGASGMGFMPPLGERAD